MAMIRRHRLMERRASLIFVVVLLQSIAALFFLGDVVGDVKLGAWGAHLWVEGIERPLSE